MARRTRRWSIGAALDWFFFVFAGLASLWLAYLGITEAFHVGWWGILFGVAFWILLAYLVLPRLHRILTTIYVPDYFIGRARTSDGLLGDPINLALMGGEAEVHTAMRRAKWTLADPVTLRSSVRIVTSTLSRRSYDEAPVSPLFLFGRQQDFAYQQEVDGNPAQRHHVRFWRCPPDWPLPGGRRVDWLAAGTFDTSVGLSLFTLQVTHRIDADTDVERDHIVATLRAADPVIGVDVIEDFSAGYHARNGGGDTIRTDGDLPIIDLRAIVVDDDAVLPSIGVGAPAEAVSTGTDPGATAPLVSRAPGSPVAKRAAFESPALLLRAADDDRADRRRPVSTMAGAALVLLRAVAGAIWLIAASLHWGDIIDPEGAGVDDLVAGISLGAFATVTVGVIVLDLVLGFVIYAGRNLARMVVLIVAVVSISTSFAGWWWQGQDITVGTTLLTVALDILILLALSSRSAAAYARRPRSREPRRVRAG